MSDVRRHEAQIVRSWNLNAEAWTAAVRAGDIASGRLVTDQAILAAAASCAPSSVLDIGRDVAWPLQPGSRLLDDLRTINMASSSDCS